ncbi:hypothetical protein [Arthrobacter sp. ZBG10]|uniref:hypothetical protein n=1 Tax=Arthrobacter sp. ZBG10 TaxID=1676590 RepID=UPI0012FA3296|nr:hypothetical protein [Arthrobacter sp. ZBG10]
MDIKRVRWLMVLLVAAAGGVNFLLKILSGDTPGDAAIGTAIYVVLMGSAVALLLRNRGKTLRRLADSGQVECHLRCPEAPDGDRYRKWNFGLVLASPGVLTFQPVLGKTTMARGAAFDLKVQEVSGSRSAPTAWDKFNQLGRKTLVLPLDTADGTVEVAGSAATLDKLESRLFEQAAENLLT